MRHHQTQDIDGTSWTVNQFSTTESIRVLTALFKVVGPAAATAIKSLSGAGLLDAKLDTDLIATALGDLATRLDEDEVVVLIKRMLSCTTLKDERNKTVNAKDQFDLVFQGRLDTLFRLLQFVLEVNYRAPFSSLLAAAFQAVDQEAATG